MADYYARKRLLFVTGLPFHKVGVIGSFWVKSKTKMWQDVVDVEKRIGAGLDKPNVRRLAQHVHDMLGGYIPLKDIERSFGYEADGPVVQQWIDQLLDEEWADKEG